MHIGNCDFGFCDHNIIWLEFCKRQDERKEERKSCFMIIFAWSLSNTAVVTEIITIKMISE
jgi:hypothetical protein